MKTPHSKHKSRGGFTLVEVAVAMGITAGVLTILTCMMGALTRDVRRLKPYEAWRRPAFVGKSDSSSSSTSSTTTDDTGSTQTPTHTLPDENLNPGSRPDESSIPPDPDDPEADPPKSDDKPSTEDSDSTPST